MRGYIIDYLSVRYAEGGLDLGPIDDLRRMDSEIRGEEHTVPLKKTAYLLLIPAAVLIISLFVVPMKTHLGEVTIIMMIEMLAIGLIITPSATTFPHGHEERYIPFHRAVTDACKRIGMDVPEFSGTTTGLDPRKLSYITVATLGLASIYWSCVLIVQMNHHFIAHRISDNGFVESMWVCETGHTIQESGLKPIPAKNKLLFYGDRHKR